MHGDLPEYALQWYFICIVTKMENVAMNLLKRTLVIGLCNIPSILLVGAILFIFFR